MRHGDFKQLQPYTITPDNDTRIKRLFSEKGQFKLEPFCINYIEEGEDTDVISTDIIGPFLHTEYDEISGEPVEPEETHVIADYLNTGTAAGKWIKHGDYYYWTEPVNPGERSGDLLKRPVPIFKVWETKDEHDVVLSRKVLYNHQVTILAEAIQADGVTEEGVAPCEDAWKVTIAEGSVTDFPQSN